MVRTWFDIEIITLMIIYNNNDIFEKEEKQNKIIKDNTLKIKTENRAINHVRVKIKSRILFTHYFKVCVQEVVGGTMFCSYSSACNVCLVPNTDTVLMIYVLVISY